MTDHYKKTDTGMPGGFMFDLADPERHLGGNHKLDLHSMCNALGQSGRFAGNSGTNTAWHSLEVAKLAKELAQKEGLPEEIQNLVYRQGLIHDIHEAITGDITRPMKAACPAIAELENRVAAVVRAELGFPPRMHELVAKADTTVGTWEWEYLVRDQCSWSNSDNDGRLLYREIVICNIDFNCKRY